MLLETSKITESLALARGSLGSSDSVLPVLACYCFDGDIVYAWNDVTAIIVPLDTGLECAVDGATLSGVLAIKSGQVDIDGKGTNMVLKFKGKGSSGVTLPALPKADFAFQFPGEEPTVTLPLTEELVQAITLCLISAAADNLVPEFAGVTLQVTKGRLTLYATDNVSAGRVVLESKYKVAGTYATVIPEQAAQQIVKLAGACGLNEATLALGDSMVCGFENATLVSKLLPAKPEKFESVFAQHTDALEYTGIPQGLAEEISLAQVLLAKTAVKDCLLTFDGKQAAINALSPLGVVAAKLPAPGPVGRVNVPPELFTRAAREGVDGLAVNDRRALVLRGGGFTHIICSAHVPEAETVAEEKPAARPLLKPKPTIKELQEEDDIPF